MKKVLPLLICLATFAQAEPEIAGVLYAVCSTNEPIVALPLKKTEVAMDVTAGIVRTEVAQRFENNQEHPLEAIYIFPLPSRAAVEDFEIRLKDKVIRSSVKEREEAKATYEQAKAAGKTTALLEQERPNIFTTSVANLMPGESVDLVFSYVETMEFRKDRFELTFPMVVGERYIPFSYQPSGKVELDVADADRINPPVLHPNLDSGHRLSLQVHISGLPLKQAHSHTHAIKVTDQGNDHYQLDLKEGSVVPNCEFNAVLRLRENDVPAVSFVQSESDEAYGLLSVFPPIGHTRSLPALPKDVVFLIDTSSSMSGDSMAQAKSGLTRCLNMLQETDRFTIVRFSSQFSGFSPELRQATEEKLNDAREFAAGLTSSGGTEMQPALNHVLDLFTHEEGRMPMVVFLTDGDVGNEDSLINLLGQKLGNTRLFTFGIGSAPNEFLMHRMAESGRGQSRFIRSHEDVGEVMSDFFETLERPVLTDVSLEWDHPSVRVYPERCPDIFYGRPLQVVAHADTGFQGHVTVRGKLDGQETSYSINLTDQPDGTHAAVEKLFGRLQVKDLMVQMMQSNDPADQEKLKQSIIRTGLRHQLVTKYTSRIAVEEVVVNKDGELVSVKVPVEVPKGWTMYATATSDHLQLLIGLLLLSAATLLRRRQYAE